MAALATRPFVEVWGDNTVGALGANGDQCRNDCRDTVDEVEVANGNATFYLLPEHGIHGNTHMMMDRNNLQIVDILLNWPRKVKSAFTPTAFATKHVHDAYTDGGEDDKSDKFTLT